jgi:hypothetical protein
MLEFKNPKELKDFLKEKAGVSISLLKANQLFEFLPIIKTLLELNCKKKTVEVNEKQIKPSPVGEKTLLKKVLKVEESIKAGDVEKALKEIISIRKGLQKKLERKEAEAQGEFSKDASELTKWYVNLWKSEGLLPPEFYQNPEPKARAYIHKMFEKFLTVLPPEEIKELYKFWLDLDTEYLPKDIAKNYAYKLILVGKSARDLRTFWHRQNLIRALKEELEKKRGLLTFNNPDDFKV